MLDPMTPIPTKPIISFAGVILSSLQNCSIFYSAILQRTTREAPCPSPLISARLKITFRVPLESRSALAGSKGKAVR